MEKHKIKYTLCNDAKAYENNLEITLLVMSYGRFKVIFPLKIMLKE